MRGNPEPLKFKEIGKFKANEFRQILLYTGIVLFQDILPPDMYTHFLLFSCAIRILDDVDSNLEQLNYADQLIQQFVEYFDRFYGNTEFTYSIHILLHLKECVDLFGPLSSFSAFTFENNFREINNLLRKIDKILQQLFNRFEEIYQFDNFTLRANSLADSNCLISPEAVAISITEIDLITNTITGKTYLDTDNFFIEPDISSNFGIIIADNLSEETQEFPLDHVVHKYYSLPYQNRLVLIPMLNFDDIIPLI